MIFRSSQGVQTQEITTAGITGSKATQAKTLATSTKAQTSQRQRAMIRSSEEIQAQAGLSQAIIAPQAKLSSPLIAVSLAFALSSLVATPANGAPAVAQAVAETPKLKLFLQSSNNVINSGNEDKSPEFQVKWQKKSDKLYAPTTKNDQQLTNLAFITKGNSSTTSVTGSTQTIKLATGSSMTKLIIDGAQQGIQMGDDGKGTLEFSSGSLVHAQAQIKLENLGSGENSIAFKGNLNFKLGMWAKAEAEFNGNVEGNIKLNIIQQNTNQHSNIFTFKGTNGLKGDIYTDFGGNQFIFEKDGITGNIRIDSSYAQYSGKVNSFTFKQENATIKGDILVDVNPKYDYTHANGKINFEENGKIEANQILVRNTLSNNSHNTRLSIDGKKNIEIEAKEILVTGYGKSSLSIKTTQALKIKADTLSIKGDFFGKSHTIVLEGGKGSQIKTPWLHNDGDRNPEYLTNMINIKLSGKTPENAIQDVAQNDANQTFLEANIKNSYGRTNIILEDAEWKSYDPNTKTSGILQHSGSSRFNAEGNRPEINLVMRNTTNKPLATTDKPNNYRIIANNRNRDTNIVLEGAHNTTFDVSYGGDNLWSTNFIFAASHTGSDQAFMNPPTENADIQTNMQTIKSEREITASTNHPTNKILGATYKDGIKLSLQNISIKVKNQKVNLLNEFGKNFITDEREGQLKVIAGVENDQHYATIQGLATGALTSLEKDTTKRNNKRYTFKIDQNSAFVGGIALTTDNVSLEMKKNSKLIVDGLSSHIKIGSLKLDNDISFDSTQSMQTIFNQTNTIINLATGVNDVYNAPEREDFRLLEIGAKANPANQAVQANPAVQANRVDANQSGFITSNNNDLTRAALFQVYVNNALDGNSTLGKTTEANNTGVNDYGAKHQSDRIIIHQVGNTTGSVQNLQIVYDAKAKLDQIKYRPNTGTEFEGNIAVATVINKANTGRSIKHSGDVSNDGAVSFKTLGTLFGFDVVRSSLVGVYTDEYGKTKNAQQASEANAGQDGAQAIINGAQVAQPNAGQDGAQVAQDGAVDANSYNTYTTYFINDARNAGVAPSHQEASALAFGTNYELYLANFNSLNKRMGELRNHPSNQGAWIRVFNGSQRNDFLFSQTLYTTIQGGYDYAFKLNGASNYLGLALSYVNSFSKKYDKEVERQTENIDGSSNMVKETISHGVELAIYNAYVQEEGWYNDSIAKLGYIFSSFKKDQLKHQVNNLSLTLSNEVGYRFKLGESKEWYIDPQFELSLGYLSQSSFKQTLGVHSLNGIMNSLLTLRSRAGASIGYDFKNFTANQPVKASVYLGTFYEFDLIKGGDIELVTSQTTKVESKFNNDHRLLLNLGTNLEIKEQTRLYFDFEKSFFGKITTDYQVNLGVRYSFGEKQSVLEATLKEKKENEQAKEKAKEQQDKQTDNKQNKQPETKQ